jgi:hypothetical protein
MEDLMSLRTFLDLSTAHLTYEDVELIEAGAMPMTCMTYEFGWVVSTAPLIDEEEREDKVADLHEAGFSETFITLAVHAGKMGTWLLRFDCDEAIDPMLPVGGYGMIDFRDEIKLNLFGQVSEEDLESCRYLVCHGAQFAFIHKARRRLYADQMFGWRDSENYLATVRWVLDLATMDLIGLQVLDDQAATWSDAPHAQRELVSASIKQLRSLSPKIRWLTDHPRSGAVPDWAHQAA